MKLSAITIICFSLLCSNVYAAENPNTAPAATTNTMPPSAQSIEAKNQMEGNAFLTNNKTKPGVVTLPDGLQYKIITAGTGATPTDQDSVVVDYTGKLIDGTEFDSSYKRGQSATFPVTAVIPGWVEALKLMKVGATWELYIPASLAYGEQGAPPAIGPNETLIFTVHLIDIKK